MRNNIIQCYIPSKEIFSDIVHWNYSWGLQIALAYLSVTVEVSHVEIPKQRTFFRLSHLHLKLFITLNHTSQTKNCDLYMNKSTSSRQTPWVFASDSFVSLVPWYNNISILILFSGYFSRISERVPEHLKPTQRHSLSLLIIELTFFALFSLGDDRKQLINHLQT